jgi:hypothetical protein
MEIICVIDEDLFLLIEIKKKTGQGSSILDLFLVTIVCKFINKTF